MLDLKSVRSFSYTPDAGYSGTVNFSYTASDGPQTSDPAVVSIDVNVAPVAGNDSLVTAEDAPLTVTAPGILGNDTDADGDPFTACYASGPADGRSNGLKGGASTESFLGRQPCRS